MAQAIGEVGRASAGVRGPADAPPVGTWLDWSTDGIPPAERLAYWREGVLRRMQPVRLLASDGKPFHGRLTRVVGDGVEFAVHASDGIVAERRVGDGCDDVSLSFMLTGGSANTRNAGEQRIVKGDLYVIDYSRPFVTRRSRHRDASLLMSRRRVREVLGGDPDGLAGLRLPRHGIAALLGAHLARLVSELGHLTAEHRAIAVSVGMEMALAAIRQARDGAVDADMLGRGLYQSARMTIERDCADPDLTPAAVAGAIGCSRASLYRLFAAHGESVAATIWAARLTRAAHLLSSPGCLDLGIGEIAFRCGFVDQPTFNRMFKRRYGRTPRDLRAEALEGLDTHDRPPRPWTNPS